MIFASLSILIGIGIIVWFLARSLFIEGYWNSKENINYPLAGQIGDFIGGFIGTIFTLVGIILLFETLSLQRKEFIASRKVFERQQFETTFFNLLNVYHEIVRSFKYEDPTGKTYTGKQFFEQRKKQFYKEFNIQGKYSKNRKEATLQYLHFYTESKEQTSNYFRTIYRVFRFIDESAFSDKDKMTYAKIVRAQLSESELFFIYYNATTEYGFRFRRLINIFNIVKHLPTIEKVEFKYIAEKISELEKNGISVVLENIKEMIKVAIAESATRHQAYLSGSISIKVVSSEKSAFKLIINRKKDIVATSSYQQGFGLASLDINKMDKFFYDFILDLVQYSNYFEKNGKETQISSVIKSEPESKKETIEIDVYKKTNKPIEIN